SCCREGTSTTTSARSAARPWAPRRTTTPPTSTARSRRPAGRGADPAGPPETRPRPRRSGQQAGDDAGQKDAVEGAGAPDRDDRRRQPLDLVEVQEVGADQRAHRAGDVRERRRAAEGQEEPDPR